MIRVHVICEGHTEEMFVNELLVTPFSLKGILLLPAKIGRPGHKGGNVNYQRLLVDIRQRLLNDSSCYCTTLLDYYGLPTAFPGKTEAESFLNSREKFRRVVESLSGEVTKALGQGAGRRFIPYIQMYEFEALLFSHPQVLADSLQQSGLAESFAQIRQQFATPEEINDNPQTAPGKRIEKLYRAYDKPVHPLLAAREIGLETICQECHLFSDWLKGLEALANGGVE
ncbi:MAG: DUF4276 family protein [Desulfobacterium sp.]|jgi:hypothetical protein|nr:DUF4276 family protein [Desulfobacterium sp.]